MRTTALQRLDIFAKSLSPFAITVFLIMLSLVLVRAPDVAPVMPSLALASVFYWTVFRPDLLPSWCIFLLALLQDLLTGAPVGVSIISFFCVVFLVQAQRRFYASGSFGRLWGSFALTAAAALFAAWLTGSILLSQFPDIRIALLQYGATVAVYPCLAWLFSQAQQAFLRAE